MPNMAPMGPSAYLSNMRQGKAKLSNSTDAGSLMVLPIFVLQIGNLYCSHRETSLPDNAVPVLLASSSPH